MTVWRELRRVEALPAGAPAHLVKAHNAVNKVAVIEGRDNASVAWHHYCEAQGGVFCGRMYRIRLDMQQQQGKNRYGEEMGMRPMGVYTEDVEYWTPPHMAHMRAMAAPGAPFGGHCAQRTVLWEIESTRHEWEIVWSGKSAPQAQPRALRAPWTCVNNCTDSKSTDAGHEKFKALAAHQIQPDLGRITLPPLPFDGWKPDSIEYLQGHDLQEWKRRYLHGPWLRHTQIKKALQCSHT